MHCKEPRPTEEIQAVPSALQSGLVIVFQTQNVSSFSSASIKYVYAVVIFVVVFLTMKLPPLD